MKEEICEGPGAELGSGGAGGAPGRDQPGPGMEPQEGPEEPGRGRQQRWEAQWQHFLQALPAPPPSAWGSPQGSEAAPWEDAKAFLAAFEQVAAACRWPRGEWGARLRPALSGEAQQAFGLLAARDQEDYGTVKAAILRGEALRREAQRQHFRQFCCPPELGEPRRLYRQIQELCCRWLRPERHTKEQILELLVLEQLLASLPGEVQSWVRAGGPDSCAQAVALLEELLASQREADTGTWQEPLQEWPLGPLDAKEEPLDVGPGETPSGQAERLGSSQQDVAGEVAGPGSLPPLTGTGIAGPTSLLPPEGQDVAEALGVQLDQVLSPGKVGVLLKMAEQTPMQSSQPTTFWKVLQEDGKNVDPLVASSFGCSSVEDSRSFVPASETTAGKTPTNLRFCQRQCPYKTRMTHRLRCLTAEEVLHLLEEEVDLEDKQELDAVIIPPDVDELTDEEQINDEELYHHATDSPPADLTGTFEVETDDHTQPGGEDLEPLPSKSPAAEASTTQPHPPKGSHYSSDILAANVVAQQPSQAKCGRKRHQPPAQEEQTTAPSHSTRGKKRHQTPAQEEHTTATAAAAAAKVSRHADYKIPEWIKDRPQFKSSPNNNESQALEALEEKYGSLSPNEVFSLFFNEEMLTFIAEQSNLYARQKNNHTFKVDQTDIKKFIGIVLQSGYFILPQIHLYWSTDLDKGSKAVPKSMSRNRFQEIKRYLHLADNTQLDLGDKFAKLRPFFNMLNQRYMQFGLFSHQLSIDERMVPYFGKHSCKMFMKAKPVRFGYKIWCLAGAGGYLFQFVPYAEASQTAPGGQGLGERVVLQLLDLAGAKPNEHAIFFDNYFTTYRLMSVLTDRGFHATGTLRESRLPHCELLEPTHQLKRAPKGQFDHTFDVNNKLSVVRWNDNSVVTVISNFLGAHPIEKVRWYNRTEKSYKMLCQPHVIHMYNKGMGGVDAHDNGVANYRITMRGKKWWWPLFSNALDSALVNAWLFYRMVTKSEIPLLDFKSEVAMSLMLAAPDRGVGAEGAGPSIQLPSPRRGPAVTEPPMNVRFDGLGHLLARDPQGRKLRCRACKIHSVFRCGKCDVSLHAKCLEKYHKK